MKLMHTTQPLLGLWLGCVLAMGASVHAAQNVYLTLKADGVEIPGDSPVLSLEREGTIECTAVNQEMFLPEGGRLSAGPFKFIKRIDRSSPLLYKALERQEQIDATFRYFRPAPSGGGTEEHYYTIHLERGHISSIRHWFPNTVDPAAVSYPHTEEVSITFQTMTTTFEPVGVSHVIELR